MSSSEEPKGQSLIPEPSEPLPLWEAIQAAREQMRNEPQHARPTLPPMHPKMFAYVEKETAKRGIREPGSPVLETHVYELQSVILAERAKRNV